MTNLSQLTVRVLVVENHSAYAEALAETLAGLGAAVLGVVPSAAAALALCEGPGPRPDLAVLDVRLDGPMDGIDLGIILQERWQIPLLFLSQWDSASVVEQSRRAAPLAFLSKDASYEQMCRDLTLVLDICRRRADGPAALYDYVLLPDATGQRRVAAADILYAEARGHDCEVVTTTGRHRLPQSLRQLLEQLRPYSLLQIHDNYLVNTNHLFDISEDGQQVQVGEATLPVGDRYREAMRECLGGAQ